MGTISGKGDKSKVMSGQTTVIANIEKWSLDDVVMGVPDDTSIGTTNFCRIYDPDDNSPEIRNLIEDQKTGWKRELAKAVAQYVIDKWEEQEKLGNNCYICPVCKGHKQIDKEKHGK